jgi:hypothetical protein
MILHRLTGGLPCRTAAGHPDGDVRAPRRRQQLRQPDGGRVTAVAEHRARVVDDQLQPGIPPTSGRGSKASRATGGPARSAAGQSQSMVPPANDGSVVDLPWHGASHGARQ